MERYIGHGYTNNKGIAKLEYDETGTQLTNSGVQGYGKGELDLKAKMHKDSATQSDLYPLWDTITYYDGTSDSVWNISNSNVDITPVDNGGRFVHSTGTLSDYVILQKANNRYWIDYDKDWCIEFSYLRENMSSIHFGITSNQTVIDCSIGLPVSSEIFVKLEYHHSENKIYRICPTNTSLNNSYEFNANNGAIGFFFGDWQHDIDITVKNLKMYYI